MSSATKRIKPAGNDDLKQQEITQAVVIADNFNEKFCPLTTSKPTVLLPVVNKTLLDYVLHSLEECDIKETFIFCCSHNKQIRSYISSSKWSDADSPMTVTVISSSSFMSMGDALRELDSKALIRSDFLLMNGDVITTLPLYNILEQHKKCRQGDKGCAMTLIYRKALPSHKTRCKEDEALIAVESISRKIRFYQRINAKKTLSIPLEVFQENEEISIHYDLLDCHISICSPCVPPLFADNFDYQTLDDLVKGLIVNEELLGNSMYIHVAEKGYGASISNLCMYDAVSQDIMGRWAYPMVPDMCNGNGLKYSHSRHNIYKEPDVELGRHCSLQQNVVVGEGTRISDDAFITNSTIGRHCSIGKNVSIKGSYLWDNVTIGDNCSLETCLLADKVILGSHVTVMPGCILDSEVIIGDRVTLPAVTRLQAQKAVDEDSFCEEDDFFSEKTAPKEIEVCDLKLVGENGHGYMYQTSVESDEDVVKDVWGKADDESVHDDDDTEDTSSSALLSGGDDGSGGSDAPLEDEDDDTLIFYDEILESLQKGIEEKVTCENIILEINSSKHAYNITMDELNMLVMKAILKIPLETEKPSAQQYLVTVKKNLVFLQPLILNYIRSRESQMDCLLAVQDFMMNNEDLASAAIKVLHFLYDRDILNEPTILQWFEKLPVESKIRKLAAAFIQWLQEADEESSED